MALPILLLLIAIVSTQIGAAFAKVLFPLIGSSGASALRLVLAALLLLVVWRPWRKRLSARAAATIVIYGMSLGSMNFLFYSALRTIPLGIAVALEFTGPLAVAMAASRRRIDFVWIALAAAGLIMLLRWGETARRLPLTGILCALGAGACWALYILFGRKAGAAHGGPSTALGMLVGAAVILPVGLMQNGLALFSPALVPVAFAVAVLSSALPYSLEMFVLPRLPTRTFGVLMSLEPAVGALSGVIFLGEHLTRIQGLAIASIMVASAGSAATSRADWAAPLLE